MLACACARWNGCGRIAAAELLWLNRYGCLVHCRHHAGTVPPCTVSTHTTNRLGEWNAQEEGCLLIVQCLLLRKDLRCSLALSTRRRRCCASRRRRLWWCQQWLGHGAGGACPNEEFGVLCELQALEPSELCVAASIDTVVYMPRAWPAHRGTAAVWQTTLEKFRDKFLCPGCWMSWFICQRLPVARLCRCCSIHADSWCTYPFHQGHR